MFEAFRNMFKIPDLRKRVFFTLGVLIILQLGYHISVPLVNSKELVNLMSQEGGLTGKGTLLGLLDMFSGGAFNRFSIFAMGIMPYISASIILQLLAVVVPFLEDLQKKGEEGRKKINQYTRYLTVAITFLQSYMLTFYIVNLGAMKGATLVANPNFVFRFMAALSMTTGTLFIMWLGERITERGIGNGISLIIFANIIARLPAAMYMLATQLSLVMGGGGGVKMFQGVTPMNTLIIAGMMVSVVAAIVVLTQAQRRIPIKRGRQTVGRRTYGGNMSYLPIRINIAGVIPVIFASSLLQFPATIAQFANSEFLERFGVWCSPGHVFYEFCYILLIVFFCYFYTAVVFNPKDVAENLQKYGSTVPGYSHGRKTELYIDHITTRVTLFGAFFLAMIAIIPELVMHYMDIPYTISGFLGGTSMIIVVGVALDTIRAIENHLLLRNYDGFRKKGRIKGRR